MSIGAKIVRVVVWLSVVVAFARGMFIFDSGPSADNAETVAAGVCFGCAMITTALMYLFDLKAPQPQAPVRDTSSAVESSGE